MTNSFAVIAIAVIIVIAIIIVIAWGVEVEHTHDVRQLWTHPSLLCPPNQPQRRVSVSIHSRNSSSSSSSSWHYFRCC
jgi:hypothetical protein